MGQFLGKGTMGPVCSQSQYPALQIKIAKKGVKFRGRKSTPRWGWKMYHNTFYTSMEKSEPQLSNSTSLLTLVKIFCARSDASKAKHFWEDFGLGESSGRGSLILYTTKILDSMETNFEVRGKKGIFSTSFSFQFFDERKGCFTNFGARCMK